MTTQKRNDELSVTEVASELGVSLKTLYRWDESGKLTPERRTATRRRFYSRKQVIALLVTLRENTPKKATTNTPEMKITTISPPHVSKETQPTASESMDAAPAPESKQEDMSEFEECDL